VTDPPTLSRVAVAPIRDGYDLDGKISGPKGAFGGLAAAPGAGGASLSRDAAGVLRHPRDPLHALSCALAGIKGTAERTHAEERRAQLAGGAHTARAAGAGGGGASVTVSQTFFRTVDAWNKMADDERELMHSHAEWLSRFRAEIEAAAKHAWSGKENADAFRASPSSPSNRSRAHHRWRGGGRDAGRKVRVPLDQSKDLIIQIERR
jgi:hypothetical protein